MKDYSKLDLFRQQVETHVATLKQALSVLKTQPFDLPELERSTQAVHGIWGTARIVKTEAIANLAQLMKECFIAAQNKAITLSEEQIDVLLHGADLLLSMSLVVDGEFDHWMSDHSWDLSTTQKAIFNALNSKATVTVNEEEREVLTGNGQQGMGAGENFPRPSTQSPVPSPQSPVPSPQSPFPSPRSPVPSPHSPVPVPQSPLPSPQSPMMDLFRLEVQGQVAILNDGLLALESNPQSAQALEKLMRSAHSIKGAARIVALDTVVNLAHSMEDCFVAAQNKAITLNADHVDVLLQAVDLLQGISQISDAELSSWLVEQGSNFVTIQGAITVILNPGSAPVGKLETEKETRGEEEKKVAQSSSSIIPRSQAVAWERESPLTEIPNQVNNQSAAESAVVIANQTAPSKVVIQERKEQFQDADAASSQTVTQDRVVRVSAENLNRIMGLAGESLIEANWLQPHADSIMSLKMRLVELSKILEELQETLDRDAYQQEAKELLEEARNREQECLDFVGRNLDELELYVQRTANLSDRLYREVISSNMRPFADGVASFPRMIRDLARQLNKQVKLDIIGKATPVDRDILKKLEAPLTHILRNATDHGIELPSERIAAGKKPEGTIRLEAFHRGGMLAITITDDGKGINPNQLRQKVIDRNLATPEMAAQLTDAELIEFLFLPGFSTAKQVSEISGRGVGLDIAKSMVQEVGGTVRATSQPGKGMSFHFQLPLTLSVVRTLLVEISDKPYAIPLARIDQIVTLERKEISHVENRQYFTMNQQNIGLIAAYQVLELPEPSYSSSAVSVVVISDQSNSYGLVVDKFLGERDLVVRPLDPRLGKVPDISATSLMGDGSPILIIDVSDMVRSIDTILNVGRLAKVGVDVPQAVIDKRKRILVVDDSITVRETERKLLENRGYYVDTAVNGVEGWNAVRTKQYDLVISDIDMPRMNGIEFVKQMKNHPRLYSMPVIVVSYRDREEDRIQGLEAGADYYLTKSSFHDSTLIDAVVNLIGR